MRAAIYCRSSKDRADASIDAQKSELASFAKTRQLRVVAEFTDAVESGKDDDRPGFQALLRAIRNPRRGWDTLLVLDTSRIARRRLLAIVFEEQECKRYGVRVLFKSLPDADPATEVLLKSVLQAMDEWHSLTSRAKGLAGMRENVRAGFRAGGRAPLGYQLEHIETGAIREGEPVRKSRLVLGPDAPAVQAYLQLRIAGVPRARAGLPDVSPASLVGLEWNALTYAGHTVWNVHAEAGSGRKRRPRQDWQVQRGTHAALIDDAGAEALLLRLEAFGANRPRRRDSGYLLAGLLRTVDGQTFHGDRGTYRVRGRQVPADIIDQAVAAKVLADLQSSEFVRAVTRAARAQRTDDTAGPLREALGTAEARLARLLLLVEQTIAPGPLLRQMEVIEGERARLSEALADAEREAAQRSALSRITEHEVRRLLVDRAATLEEADPEALRDALGGLLSRVELDGDELALHYAIGRFNVASPRGAEAIPVKTNITLPRRRA